MLNKHRLGSPKRTYLALDSKRIQQKSEEISSFLQVNTPVQALKSLDTNASVWKEI